jgi:acetate kinase
MVLLFEPQMSVLRWHQVDAGGRVRQSGACDAVAVGGLVARQAAEARLDAVGYLLPHGGEWVDQEIQPLSRPLPASLSAAVGLLPEPNGLALAAMRAGLDAAPAAPQFLLCETAYFLQLPASAAHYALPARLRLQGLRRFGAAGLWHRWAWEQAQRRHRPAVARLLSVHVDGASSMAAIVDGQPVETTAGFTGVEGLPSTTACGDLDPTIALHLRASGMTFAEIGQLLGRDAGFSGLLGRPCSLRRLIEDDDPAVQAVRDVFLHHLRRQTGALLAAAGGAEALAVVGEEADLCEWVGVRLAAWVRPVLGRGGDPAGEGLQVWAFPTTRGQIMAERIYSLACKGEHHDS